jgi:hypothetical protein
LYNSLYLIKFLCILLRCNCKAYKTQCYMQLAFSVHILVEGSLKYFAPTNPNISPHSIFRQEKQKSWVWKQGAQSSHKYTFMLNSFSCLLKPFNSLMFRFTFPSLILEADKTVMCYRQINNNYSLLSRNTRN